MCVVGLDPNFAPDLKVFDAVSLEKVRKFENLCRVCLNTTEIMTPIFEDLEIAPWADKIHKHLSIQVRSILSFNLQNFTCILQCRCLVKTDCP